MKIFRKLRKENLSGKGVSRYMAYAAGEIILVVAGILIALQIDNWNQDRQERKLERVLLRELLVNLKDDLKDIEVNYKINTECQNSNRIILNYLEEQRPYHDSLTTHFGHLVIGTIFANNISTYESIKSIGIDIISNDQLRNEISGLYSVTYEYLRRIEGLHHQFGMDFMFPVISEKFNTIEYFNKAVPLDKTNHSGLAKLKESIKFNLVWLSYQVGVYAQMKKSITRLIGDIEKELG